MAGERALTARLARFFGAARRVVVGIGDDAAVLKPPPGDLVVTCDPVVAGVHFAAEAPPARVGRKAVDRNLSDLAAMGAVADHLIVSLLLPIGYPVAARRALLGGIRSAARRADCAVIGGDVGTTPGPLTVTVTALGHLRGRPLRRDGARIGDRVHVTGPLGGSLASGRHLRIRPRLAEGQWLAKQPAVRAGLDVSDGLALDLWTLLRASGVPGAELDAAAIPLHRDCARAAAATGRRPLDCALGDGEDHELLFTVAAGATLPPGGPLAAVARRPIGVLAARPGLWLRHRDGRRERIAAQGYEHDVD
ncbi:MAG: thiamine-monophosphate kinase [Planctomycetes bacterium]|nr:thiamine-monophosphate kinase [Planctomycetota bacterium]